MFAMVGILYVLSVVLVLSESVNSCTDGEQASQNFYNIKYIQVPLLLIHAANYSQEAQAAVQLYKEVSLGHVLQGLTKMLRPYRVQVNNISQNLCSGPASECSSKDTVAKISSTISVLLPDSAREIAQLYVQSYNDCANQSTERLLNRLRDLTELEVTLKDIIAQGGAVDDIKELLLRVLREVDTDGTLYQDMTDVLSFSTFDKDLFIAPMCLFYALIDAAQAANAILRQISGCASKAGVPVSIQEIIDPETALNIPSVLKFLLSYYDATRDTSFCQTDLYVMIQYLSYEIEKSRNELAWNGSVESLLEGSEKLKRVLTLAAESTNVTFKTCVYEAYKYSKADVAEQLSKRKSCEADSIARTLQLQASFNATFLELGSDYLSQIPSCIATNLLNTNALAQCTLSIYNQLKKTLAASCDAYDRAVLDMSEYFGMQKSCRPAGPSLEQIYNCDKKLLAFIV